MLKELSRRERMVWLTCLIDGEGYVFLQHHRSKTCKRGFSWRAGVRVSNTNIPLLSECSSFWGGRTPRTDWKKQTEKNKWKPRREWRIPIRVLREIISDLIQFSIVKKKQFIILKEALDLLDRTKWGTNKNPYDDRLEELCVEIYTLNKRGV